MSWVVKRDPFGDLRNMQDDFNRLFTNTLPRLFNGEEVLSGSWSPRVDIAEGENAIVLEADLPGMNPEDFKLSIENFKLTLSGERKFEDEKKDENWHRVERSYGSFARTFSLPNTVNAEEVKADFRDGVLRVTLPKREEVKARQIEVKVGNLAKAATN
ncbi:MAG: Hsp20/alpha crystallin family protein [Blastocatellia bacterium]